MTTRAAHVEIFQNEKFINLDELHFEKEERLALCKPPMNLPSEVLWRLSVSLNNQKVTDFGNCDASQRLL